ncbi:MAG: hypothetical protein KDA81_06005 [Planctomycetaceae bacterium]|nr:hypothetical protein [Planctomycetaceae bacterium]
MTLNELPLDARNAKIRQVVAILPGSQPYLCRRPLNVNKGNHGKTLLGFLCDRLPHIDLETWRQKIDEGMIIQQRCGTSVAPDFTTPGLSAAVSPDQIVQAGQIFEHLVPRTIEPDVNANITVLFESQGLIAVNKPAPLPMHASGRFCKNTLQHILSLVYPEKPPLIVHRLDANTSGVVLLACDRATARHIQNEFEQRAVQKTYIAQVHGHPREDRFSCDAPIARQPAEQGLRGVDLQFGLNAVTHFEVLSRHEDGTSFLRASPVTGRTNQIRIHLWHLGFPIVGDPAYLKNGCLGTNRTLSVSEPQLCLHAHSIFIATKTKGMRPQGCGPDSQIFFAPLPPWAENLKLSNVP